jgi:hypothetical protein
MAISERGEPGGAGGGWGTPPGHPDVRTFLGVPLFVGPRVGLRDLHFGLRHNRSSVSAARPRWPTGTREI